MSAGEGDVVEKTLYWPLRDHPDDYIAPGATGKALEWLEGRSGPTTGVIIAGNYGRPGGGCIDVDGNFVDCTGVDTQEESVLSFFAAKSETIKKTIVTNLTTGTIGTYRMGLPKGEQTDFDVRDGTDHNGGELVNIQTAGEELYRREYGFVLSGAAINIYLSFVSGPNTSPQDDPWPDPRSSRKLDTMYRCASLKASAKYHVFRRMVYTALWASLNKMLDLKLNRVIIAAISCGIYADKQRYRSQIRREYPDLCREVIASLYERHNHRFTEVLIPTWFSDGTLYGPCRFGMYCDKIGPNGRCPFKHVNCRYGDDCRIKDTCPYLHPKPCKYGNKCRNKYECPYSHPDPHRYYNGTKDAAEAKGIQSNRKVKNRFKI